MEDLFPAHALELSVDRDRFKAKGNYAIYDAAEKAGMLIVVTVRDCGNLIGYFVGSIMPHLHYADAGPMFQTDMYYLKPEYRVGGIGAKMLIFLENVLRDRGVVKMYASTKVHQDHSALFESLGYRFTDRVFTKVLT